MRYIFSAAKDLTKTDMDRIMQGVEKNYSEGSEVAMTLADMLRDEGMEKGGVVALSETALQILIERFGKIPQDIKEGIASADTAALKLLLVNSYKFQELDEARRYIQ